MKHENSRQCLINKKIAQLVKLINHLDTINANREHEIYSLNIKFNDQFQNYLFNFLQSMQNVCDEYGLIDENTNNLIKCEYKNQAQKIISDYSICIAKSKENMIKFSKFIDDTSSDFIKIIQSIYDNNDIFLSKIISLSDEQANNIKIYIEQLNKEYQAEVSLIDIELYTRINNFENHSIKKLKTIIQNFNTIIQKSKILNDLLIEKQNIIDFNSKKVQLSSETEELTKIFETEKIELIKRLENDLNNAKKQGKLMSDTVSDAHRNEIFVRNNEIARTYDAELGRIQKENEKANFLIELNEINSIYEKKFKEMEDELNNYAKMSSSMPSLLVSSSDDIEKLNELKKSKIESIEIERKSLIDSFQSLEQMECSRHEKIINENNDYLNRKSIELAVHLQMMKNEFNSKFDRIEISIKKCQNMLEKEKQKNNSSSADINEAFDHDEIELKTALLNLQIESEKKIEEINKSHENKKEILNRQTIEINEKIQEFKKLILIQSNNKSSFISQSIIDANHKCAEIQENANKQKAVIMNSLNATFEIHQNNHFEKLNNLHDQIMSQKVENKKEKCEKENQAEKNIINLNKQLELFKENMADEVNEYKTEYDLKISNLEKIINEKEEKKSILINSFNDNTMRDEEHLIIEKLESDLAFLEQHLKDVTFDLANYKKRIVSQEGTYNSQFGNTPTVAVLRPNTGFGQINTRGSLRPNTTFAINRSKSLMKSQTNKYAVHF